ncbi:hypothetical protein QZN06_22320 [Burkholderia multivorans]|uniref:hypothetical protein n=1 Tax=Burkholderia multivorans TaxID=87883 RepID=UPI000754C70C|nr:hypothetical protein [Burkholderia multivorans]AOK66486.1 hypothetical protein WM33_12595 [Burkholderia multivorans]KVZ77435.1 hypothetical protein WL23_21295 [Burkholderia multivorans]MBU9289856.1 hypothetical protein [Burkholderia multivorans]MDN8011321.1 hypothetical protein [Burkholderia multivorans]
MIKPPMPKRLRVVGELERKDHPHLPDTAKCYFWGEYTPYEHTNGEKWNFSETNQLISNLKKKKEREQFADWRYKSEAIDRVARHFAQFWKWAELKRKHRVCLIPVPPSKKREDPNYDPRMMQVLERIAMHSGVELDIRDCLSFSGRFTASHESEYRPTPDELYDDISFDEDSGDPDNKPGLIFLFDDMLTTGAHYVAASRELKRYFARVEVVGQFVARRIVPDPFADFDDLDVEEEDDD